MHDDVPCTLPWHGRATGPSFRAGKTAREVSRLVLQADATLSCSCASAAAAARVGVYDTLTARVGSARLPESAGQGWREVRWGPCRVPETKDDVRGRWRLLNLVLLAGRSALKANTSSNDIE